MKIILSLDAESTPPDDDCHVERVWIQRNALLPNQDQIDRIRLMEKKGVYRNVQQTPADHNLHSKISYEYNECRWIREVKDLKDLADFIECCGDGIIGFYKSPLNPGYMEAEW